MSLDLARKSSLIPRKITKLSQEIVFKSLKKSLEKAGFRLYLLFLFLGEFSNLGQLLYETFLCESPRFRENIFGEKSQDF